MQKESMDVGGVVEVDLSSGLVKGARVATCPNHDLRPDGTQIETLIVHSISLPPGQYGGPGVERLFANQLDPEQHPYFEEIAHFKVSAHLFLRRDGELVQFVPLHRRAWHAGESYCEGRTRVNDFSVGIELEGTDRDSFADVQYARLGAITRELMRVFPAITPRRIYAHSDVAPGRKTDPGSGFDWDRYLRLLG